MDERKITIRQLIMALTRIKEQDVNDSALILWAKIICEGDGFGEQFGAPPGTLMFGIEDKINGETEYGTIRIEPERISDYLS